MWAEYTVHVGHNSLFLLRLFYSISDQTSCSLFREPGSWGPRRLVRVAFYMFGFFFSSRCLLTAGASFSVLPDDNMCGTMRDSHPHTVNPLATNQSRFSSTIVDFCQGFIYIIPSRPSLFTSSHIIVTLPAPQPPLYKHQRGKVHFIAALGLFAQKKWVECVGEMSLMAVRQNMYCKYTRVYAHRDTHTT